ncbi:MAG: M6 family metalloprotease domain-containing protein [Lentimicrobiaceae bacterium]|nr:M6 family metalloprotease domain-containing protein [Lentimicrobiaceae bacterium]
MKNRLFRFFTYKLQVTGYELRVTSYLRCINTSTQHHIISAILLFCFAISSIYAAPLKEIPMTLLQPNGDTLHCLASGDEFFNYLHDENGFTIIQNHQGYYMYATYDGDKIVPSQYIAGTVDPVKIGLQPNVLISNKEYQKRRAEWFNFKDIPRLRSPERNHGKMNNLVVFIRFSDEADIKTSFEKVDNMFNNQTEGFNSMSNYFHTTSYGQFNISSSFYPESEEDQILSYQDDHPRSYYQPYNDSTNTNGYPDGDHSVERNEREHELLRKAVAYIADLVPADLDIDYNNDGYVDNVCFVVKGDVGAWATLLWPHRWSLYSTEAFIHGKRVWDYNFMLEGASNYFNTSVLSHEMQHSLSYPDLYHYSYTGPTPCGSWDIMEQNHIPTPQQSGAYMKWKYGNWLPEPTEIPPGKFSINSVGSGLGFVSYKISTEDPNQFFVLECRNSSDQCENFGYGNVNGLLIYRINTNWDGNASYSNTDDNGEIIYDEVYIFRPYGNTPDQEGSMKQAHFGPTGRTIFNANSNPRPFLTDGTYVTDLSITNITVNGSKISFTCNEGTTQYVSVAFLPNDAEGKMLPQMFEAGVPQKLQPNSFTLDGRYFKGWAIEPEGEVVYANNEIITIDEDIVLYPIFYPLGINEIYKTSCLFTIQPNPADNYVEIIVSDDIPVIETTAHIFDLYGKKISSHHLPPTSSHHKIDISNLSKGFYFVRIENEAKKLIVK